ncbi:Serine/threonine protein kinase [Candidatus Sulfopaludibacter sp. SbA4]|nr:Serine/threonine protein kinase [Candidatus Sulfopaludibacter sp. SbA4]
MTPPPFIGHYRITAKLGEGGMGAVYRATDTKLNREVAIKILPEAFASDPDRMARFTREAQVLASVNHPNIAAIYGVEDRALVLELVEGETLAGRIARGPIPIEEALPVARQIAEALEYAHDKGIVHRDLKPSNVMITGRGLVKVLDFGIAKVAGASHRDAESHPTQTLTKAGHAVGTIAYMSPEQARGKEVDPRSDIFAFGCLLYEMLTGKAAFHGEDALTTLAAIVGANPRPALELVPGLPKPVGRIIDICLRKKPFDRWQSVGDVKLLLESALEDLASPADSPLPPRGRLARLAPALALAAVGGWLLTAAALYLFLHQRADTAGASVLRRVTSTPGLSAFPALSRDGNLLAFASDRSEEGNLDIWVQQIGGRDPIRLTRDPADDSDPTISPDGTRIAFRSERAGPSGQGGIYVVPTLGSDPVLLAPRGRNPRFSPDGRWIAYWEGRESGGFYPGSASVFVVDAGGGQPRQIAAEMAAALYPVWSPKGDRLLVLAQHSARADRDWWIIPFEKGSAHKTGALPQIESQGLRRAAWEESIPPLEWRADGSGGVVFAASSESADGEGDAGNLWQIVIGPGGSVTGRAVSVTHGPGVQAQASAAGASERGRLAFADLSWKPDVWATPVDAERGVVSGERRRVTADEPYALAPSVSADGSRLVFLSRQLGRWTLRTQDLATGKVLTLVNSAERLYNPKISGDGTTIVYVERGGHIFSVPSAGGSVEKLCQGCGTTMGISFDGKRISYEPFVQENLTIYDVAQRKSVILAPQPPGVVLTGGQFSPDQKWIAFHSVGNRASTSRIWIARIDGSLPVPQSDWIPVTDGNSMEMTPAWSPSGNLLYFLSERDGFRCIRAVKLDPVTRKPAGESFAVQHFHTARWSLKRINGTTGMNGLSVAPGRMFIAFGELTGDIWLEEKP